MSTRDDGGPAFPANLEGSEAGVAADGMTLRDYAEIQAMAALLANPAVMTSQRFELVADGAIGGKSVQIVARVHADAMLAARNAPESAQEP